MATEQWLVDAMAARFVLRHETLDVVVASNLFADILSDLGSALAGSLGIAALLAACGKDSKPDRAAASTTPTNTSADVVALLERSGSCSVVPELTEGPYYIDVDKVRSDIREDRPGTALTLAIRVRDSAGCTPRANAVVDVWHCDAGGIYFNSGNTTDALRDLENARGHDVGELVAPRLALQRDAGAQLVEGAQWANFYFGHQSERARN